MLFVEPYAGTAAITLALFGQKSPLSRPGNKNKLSSKILEYIPMKPNSVLLSDSDANMRALLRVYFDTRLHSITCKQLHAWNTEDPLTLWNSCVQSVKTGAPTVAEFLVAATWAVSKGAGISYSYAGPGKVTRSGLTPAHVRCTANIANRLPLLSDVSAVVLDSAQAAVSLANMEKSAIIYFDPPYTETKDRQYASTGNYAQAINLISTSHHPCLLSSGKRLFDFSKKIGSNRFMGMSADKNTKGEEWLTIWSRGLFDC